MTKEELQHRTNIQAAYLAGQPIQIRYRNEFNPKWIDSPNPSFDWECYDYRIKPGLWRAKQGDIYYFIADIGEVVRTKEVYCVSDSRRYIIGNYFATEEKAQQCLKELKEVFLKHIDV